ncbi:HU family DNA-binding protein [Pandoraea norimbergensis]|uniref:DNA-binding protein n=1 Tax=Pandoraea norimbergensis TaxID=93219 RepID=A0ABN4JPM8_9BURK|nr:HU family DNA-binding protein [Pandoraea norimbergensis]ALS60701.1 DNA-binding protein [Pandoraea norimbergensis]ALS61958.1 DNA-binding protein [Pandoraea norimbergensis]
MNKQELIKQLANNADVTNKQAEAVLNALSATVLNHIGVGKQLMIPDLGKFTLAERAAKIGRNPKTGEAIQIAAKRVPKFTPAKALKDAAAG